jgi:hypothetical protein
MHAGAAQVTVQACDLVVVMSLVETVLVVCPMRVQQCLELMQARSFALHSVEVTSPFWFQAFLLLQCI